MIDKADTTKMSDKQLIELYRMQSDYWHKMFIEANKEASYWNSEHTKEVRRASRLQRELERARQLD